MSDAWGNFCIKTLTTPNPPKSSKGHFLEKLSAVGNWYFHLFKWGKITTWQEVQAISAEYENYLLILTPFFNIFD